MASMISIIIPTINRAGILSRTLKSVGNRVGTGCTDVEVVIVDNGSVDETASVCQGAQKQFPLLTWRYFLDEMPGLLTGRHRGALEAHGDLLVFLDDDVLLAPTWMEALRDAFSNPSTVLVGGPSEPRFEIDPPPWMAALWHESNNMRSLSWLSLIDQGSEKKRTDPCLILGLNYAIRRDTLLVCGGFHPDIVPTALQRYQGDGETGLSLKIKARGLGALYHPNLAVTHLIPSSRLTLEAFQHRAFFQGVCDSYTVIRRDGAVSADGRRFLRDMLRPLKRRLQELSSGRDDADAVGRRLRDAYTSGFAFHQNEVRNDPQLLEWVLRPDYWDYRLPKEFSGHPHRHRDRHVASRTG
jgi:glucosyl-dolichyl phosphate glucuronosyltransferase